VFAFRLLLGRGLLGLLGFDLAFRLLLGRGLLSPGLAGLGALILQSGADLVHPVALDGRKDRAHLESSILQVLEDGFLGDLELGRDIGDSGLTHEASLSVIASLV